MKRKPLVNWVNCVLVASLAGLTFGAAAQASPGPADQQTPGASNPMPKMSGDAASGASNPTSKMSGDTANGASQNKASAMTPKTTAHKEGKMKKRVSPDEPAAAPATDANKTDRNAGKQDAAGGDTSGE